jgi:MoxR-like ATPase
VIITSNNEKELPDAFLRRCFFHYIRFPDDGDDEGDRRGAFPRHQAELLTTALTQFYEIREAQGLKKKPSTSEVLDWLKLLLAEDLTPEDLRRDGASALPKLHGALLKNEQDVACSSGWPSWRGGSAEKTLRSSPIGAIVAG